MKPSAILVLLLLVWIVTAWLCDHERREQQAAFNSCVEQSRQALDTARECDDALGWCLGALRTGPRIEL